MIDYTKELKEQMEELERLIQKAKNKGKRLKEWKRMGFSWAIPY